MKLFNTLTKHHYLVVLIELALVLLCLLLFPGNTQAQERHIIQGIIYEKESEMPLAGAHVLIEGTSFGTISGPDGTFRISASGFPLTIKVTYIGFEDRYFTITEEIKDELLMLGMKYSAEMLEGVTITDKKAELVFRDESYSVLDFEFHENGLMLLIFRNRLNMAELVLLSTLNDTLAQLTELPGRANSLHRDCRDFIHYVAADTAYQVQFTGDKLRLVHPVTIETFIPVANAFKAYYHDNYYFAINRMHKQMIDYIRYDSVSESYVPFRTVYDSKTLGIMKDNPEHFGMLAGLMSDEFEFNILKMGSESSFKDQRDARNLERSMSIEAHYLRECVYYPVYAPLFKSKEEFILFNHPESVIEFLTPYGKPIRSTNIMYHNLKGWEDLILKDEIHDKYYAVFKTMNRVSLCTVDINTGQLGPANILYYPFVKKILVRNGYAYFMYRPPGSIERTMLFRQKLQSEINSFVSSEH